MRKKAKRLSPQYCMHCGESIAQCKPVSEFVLACALAVLHGARNAREVARILDIPRTHVSDRLRAAEALGLIRTVARESAHVGGGTIKIYAPAQRLKSFDPLGYRLYEKAAQQKRAS